VDFTPIFIRELIAAARRGRLLWGRAFFAFSSIAIVLGMFAIRYSESKQSSAGHRLLGTVAWQSFAILAMVHAFAGFTVGTTAAVSIAREKDRRTLDFLLATRLSNTEIILGKFLSVMLVFLTTIAASLPVMLLITFMGGVDFHLLLLTYAGVTTTTYFVACLSIWASTVAKDARGAATAAVGYTSLWFTGPMIVGFMLPRFGIPIPSWIGAANAWFWISSPVGLLMKFAAGGLPFATVLDAVVSMAWRQLLTGTLFLLASILQLRSAYRVNTGGDGRGPAHALSRISWRMRPRPDVGDDPIVWREQHTRRSRGFSRFMDSLVHLGIITTLVISTGYFGWPALVEVWRHGYTSGPSTNERPDFNIFLWFFTPRGTFLLPLDQSRIDFNVFLRFLSIGIVFFVAFLTPSFAVETILVEQSKETWASLLTTPLTGREILKSKMLAALWRIRPTLITLLILWILGLIVGAIHPLGFIVVLLIMTSAIWCFLTFGMRSAVFAAGGTPFIGIIMLLTFTAALPFILPTRFSSVLFGFLSLPFDVALALVTYRDIRVAKLDAPYPFLQWIGLNTGEGPLQVVMTCLIAILVPAFAGVVFWKQAIANFDQKMSRPFRDPLPNHKNTASLTNPATGQG
jgi:ABC-type Na+ efflux pump permease subunit